jgi:hypothetical protein
MRSGAVLPAPDQMTMLRAALKTSTSAFALVVSEAIVVDASLDRVLRVWCGSMARMFA